MFFKKQEKRENLKPDELLQNRNTISDFFYALFNKEPEAVTTDMAIRTSSVYACVKIISNHIAMLPLQLYKIDKTGKRIRDKKHKVSMLLEKRPNPYLTPFEFKQILESHRQLYGNGFAEIQWSKNGYPKALWILNPTLTKVQKDINNNIWVLTTLPDGTYAKLPYEDVIHLKSISLNGLTGISPIEVARRSISIQNSSQKYVDKFYTNGTLAGGILKTPTQLNKEAKDKVRTEWEKYANGLNNANRVAILDAGLDYQSLGVSQSDAQFIETQKFTAQEISKIYSVPPHMLGELDRATFSNIEQQSMEFVRDTLTPLLVSWEQTLEYQLLSDKDINENEYYLKFNLNSILRGDSLTRANFYEKMINMGAYSVNEVRELEDKDSIVEGNKHYVSLNYVDLKNMDEYQMSKNQTQKGGGKNNGE